MVNNGTNFKEVQAILGYKFKNLSLLEEALTHPSAFHISGQKGFNYQRLEFLGDAVLSLVIAEYLFQKHSNFKESKLSNLRANIVSKSSICRVATKLSLENYIIMSYGEENAGGRENRNNIENVVEAIIAAIYLDGGLDYARKFILDLWSELLNNPLIFDQDPKTELQELLQSKKFQIPKYEILENKGSSHQPYFVIKLSVDGFDDVLGHGNNRKDGEKFAAENFMEQYRDKIEKM